MQLFFFFLLYMTRFTKTLFVWIWAIWYWKKNGRV